MFKLLFLLSVVLVSCNTGTPEKSYKDSSIAVKENQDTDTANQVLTGCYLRVVQRDTVIASLLQDGNNVTGKLVFDNYEKDGSTGSVSGKIEGDILKLVYRFQSEGMNSISEQYFRITIDGLLHGIGEVAVKGDSAYYTHPSHIRYNERDKLRRISCAAGNDN